MADQQPYEPQDLNGSIQGITVVRDDEVIRRRQREFDNAQVGGHLENDGAIETSE